MSWDNISESRGKCFLPTPKRFESLWFFCIQDGLRGSHILDFCGSFLLSDSCYLFILWIWFGRGYWGPKLAKHFKLKRYFGWDRPSAVMLMLTSTEHSCTSPTTGTKKSSLSCLISLANRGTAPALKIEDLLRILMLQLHKAKAALRATSKSRWCCSVDNKSLLIGLLPVHSWKLRRATCWWSPS